jgi:hypothetical protein
MFTYNFKQLISLGLLLVIANTACRDIAPPLPEGMMDPNMVRTPDGAIALYRGALSQTQNGLFNYIQFSGLLSDELTVPDPSGPPGGFDPRIPIVSPSLYAQLHAIRNQARQARLALTTYAPATPSSLRGELYAIEAYAEVFLAEFFCSGILLSTVEFEGDWTYSHRFTRTEVYEHAIALFDSALTLSVDSARIYHLASIGRGRALVGLEQFDEAVQSVQSVPTAFIYGLPFNSERAALDFRSSTASVADREGVNGLPFRSSNDPRSASREIGRSQSGIPQFLPRKIDAVGQGGPATPMFVVASGIEARLIEAEGALRNGEISKWAGILDTLRATAGAYLIPPVGSLPAISDDSTTLASDSLRIDVMFHERAYWLFFSGHRQGDMRRLIRQYGRDPESVYPTGFYGPKGPLLGYRYGESVVGLVPDPVKPSKDACLNRDA